MFCVAVPPTVDEAVKLSSVKPAGQAVGASTLVADVTLLSVSEAVTLNRPAVPLTRVVSGHRGRMGALPPPPPLPQALKLLAVLRGAGAPVVKSVPLLPVSVQPLPARKRAVVLVAAGAAAAPSKKLALPKPTRSSICASWAAEQTVEAPLQARPAVVVARMTLPAVADRLRVPVASAVGSAVPVVVVRRTR